MQFQHECFRINRTICTYVPARLEITYMRLVRRFDRLKMSSFQWLEVRENTICDIEKTMLVAIRCRNMKDLPTGHHDNMSIMFLRDEEHYEGQTEGGVDVEQKTGDAIPHFAMTA